MISVRPVRHALIAAVAVLVLAACGADGENSGASVTASTSPAATGSDLLAVTAPVVGGGEIDLAARAGEPLALWFWAPT